MESCYFYNSNVTPYSYPSRQSPSKPKGIVVCEYCGTWYIEMRSKCSQCGAPISLNYAQLLQTDDWRIK